MALWIPVVSWLSSFFVEPILAAVLGTAVGGTSRRGRLQSILDENSLEMQRLNSPVLHSQLLEEEFNTDYAITPFFNVPQMVSGFMGVHGRLASVGDLEREQERIAERQRLMELQVAGDNDAIRGAAQLHATQSVQAALTYGGAGLFLAGVTALVAASYNASHPVVSVSHVGSSPAQVGSDLAGSLVDTGVAPTTPVVNVPETGTTPVDSGVGSEGAKGFVDQLTGTYTGQLIAGPCVCPVPDPVAIGYAWGPFVIPPPPRREWTVAYANPLVYIAQ